MGCNCTKLPEEEELGSENASNKRVPSLGNNQEIIKRNPKQGLVTEVIEMNDADLVVQPGTICSRSRCDTAEERNNRQHSESKREEQLDGGVGSNNYFSQASLS